jgi:hypothetical protein
MPSMPAPLDVPRRVLVPVSGPASAPTVEAHAPRIRRYRMARTGLYTRPDPARDRFAYLRTTHD